MIGYTCKYTPVELLAALGGRPALLNREAAAFSHAEALTHNHFCCHAKAVLEECRRDGVRELVLVNCCDSIRRCYDVLRAQGGWISSSCWIFPTTTTAAPRPGSGGSWSGWR